MKAKIVFSFALVLMLGLGACHYGQDAVKEDRARNEEYKGKRAEREAQTTLPDDAAEKMKNGHTESAEEPAEADSTATED